MSRITILSENLANQIAAGEVVERPASVVKELVENSIDSGASHIDLQVEGGGTRLLRVMDDGSGMDQDDLLLCLERHATSKLQTSAQLADIKTLGFRGEAIPSIASVSKLTITSKLAEHSLGNRIEVEYGSVKKIHEMGCSQGTVVEVSNLFGNVPARRKFLKTTQTELSHIDATIRAHALCHPQISFTYQVNGKVIFELVGQGDSSLRRVKQALGYDETDLINVASDTETHKNGDVIVEGFVVPPDQTKGKNVKLWIFVNGRHISDRMINHAVFEGLQGFVMKGRRTAGVIYISVPPTTVDVNVHPTKQEVRFHQTNRVHKAVVLAVEQGMSAYQQQLKYKVFGKPDSATSFQPDNSADVKIHNATQDVQSLPSMEPQPLYSEASQSVSVAREMETVFRTRPKLEPEVSQVTPDQAVSTQDAMVDNSGWTAPVCKEGQKTQGIKPRSASLEEKQDTAGCDSVNLRYIGQLQDAYILCENEAGMVVIDQHAAQERLLFEELKKQHEKVSIPSQVLMFPQMVELSPEEVGVLEQYGNEVAKLGLETQAFGGESYIIKAVPVILSHLLPEEILRSILVQFSAGEGLTHSTLLEDVLASMACKASIKAGHRLEESEVEHLLGQMIEAGVFSHCPHGRPVVKEISARDIQNWFHRT